MFDISWGELVLIGIVALIVIGPKELPGVLRSLGQWTAKIKHMAGEFQGQFQEAMREAEMADLKKQADNLTGTVSDIANFDPMKETQAQMERAFAGESEPAKPSTEQAEAAASVQTAPEVKVDVPLPEPATPVTEKDFAPAEPAPTRQAGSGG
jgi:sec-independent protein translocase protein TatB